MKNKTFSLWRGLAVGVLMLFSASVFAQTTATGVVEDAASGEPIIGASILEVGTTNGTITDFDGNFTLTVADGATLEISYIGYKTQSLPAGQNMKVRLGEDNELLDEVVVVGYGVVKKNDATGSVTAIKPDDMNKGLTTTATDMLSGKVAGVNITTDGGAPGAGSTIRIRGGSSLNASNDPLIVIDGLAMDNNGIQGMSNILSMVNPNDIETFTVLKDASATAIYGSRASNGVILITTKKGAAGSKPKFQYDGNVSANIPAYRLNVLNASEYRDFIGTYFPEQVGGLGTEDTDWQKEIFRVGVNTDHNFSITGGTKHMPYRASLGYTLQNGIMDKSQMQRVTAAINLSPSFLDKHLTFNLNAKGMYLYNKYNDGSGIVSSAISYDPTLPVKSDMREFGGYYQYSTVLPSSWADPTWTRINAENVGQNPVAQIANRDDVAHTGIFIGNIEADYKIHGFEDLHLHANFGADYSHGEETNDISPYSFGNNYFGYHQFSSADKYNLQFNAYAQYYKDFNENHHFDAMIGYEWQHFHKTLYNNSYGLYQDTWTADGLGGKYYNYIDYYTKADPHIANENYLVSFFGRLNYIALNRYMVTVTLRGDGSSKFAKGNRWGLFPSVALGWKIKEEAFLRDVNWLSELKLRLGYGITGQQDIGDDYISLIRYTKSIDYAQITLGEKNEDGTYKYYDTYRPEAYNKDLTWEKTTTYNAGLDFGFMKGRFTGSVDYYYRKTTDLIAYVNIPSGINFSNKINKNIGSLSNQGVEVMLNATAIDKMSRPSKFKWDLGFNFTWNKNKIESLSDGVDQDFFVEVDGTARSYGNGVALQRHQEGYAASTFFLYKTKVNEDGYIELDGNERVAMHKPAPDFTLGLQSKWQFYHFDIGISFRASIGNYVYNNVKAGQISNGANTVQYGAYKNWLSDAAADYGKYYNTKTKSFTIDPEYLSLSDQFLENGSFLRCDNITIGYTFDKNEKLKARLYGTVQNPFIITGYSGLDPEISNGIDNSIYPRSITVLVGVNMNF